MRKEWECPDNCPNRKPGCQNPNTCERYALRLKMIEKSKGFRRVFPNKDLPRSVKSMNGKRRNYR